MPWARPVWLLLLSLFGSAHAEAQTTVGSWRAEWKAPYCIVSTGSANALSLSIWSVPGASITEVYFLGAKDRVPELPNGSDVPIMLGPMVDTVPAEVVWQAPVWTGVLKLAVGNGEFLKKFSKSDELGVVEASKPIDVTYRDADQAVKALQHCIDQKASEWGLDLAALAALRSPPQLRGGWVTTMDYPEDALDHNQSGTVVVRITTNEKGHATSCAVVQSSKVFSLDELTCRVALKRAVYKPAIGANGYPMPATFISFANFLMVPRE